MSISSSFSRTGIALFALAILCATDPNATVFAYRYFQVAGWLITAGWLLGQKETDAWPFTVPELGKTVSDIVSRAVAVINRRG